MRVALALLLALPTLCAAQPEGDATPVWASSTHSQEYLPELAVDGNPNTRWASALNAGEGWLTLDLGAGIAVDRLTILWETARAVDYEVQVSDDGRSWRTLARRTDAPGGHDELTGLGGSGRFLRIRCLRDTGTFPLYSIWEVSSPDPALQAAISTIGARAEAIRLERTRGARERLRETWRQSGPIVFAVRYPGVDGHWYGNFGYYAFDAAAKCYRTGGAKLVRLDPASGEVATILADEGGCIRDPAVSHDGTRIVFSYLPSGSEDYHLWQIAPDGSGLRQLTEGDCDDIEPAWLPDGGIVFCSSRCNRWVNCWLTPVAVLYRMDADGSNLRPLSSNNEHDNTPWPLPDGRILYTRWEYVDRSQVDYHHLWTANPDGTQQTVFYGNMAPGLVMIDAKPVPGTGEVLSVFSPGHGMQEHAGPLAIVDPKEGPDALPRARYIPAGSGVFRDPWALGADCFLAAEGSRLVLIDRDGAVEEVWRLPPGDQGRGLLVHEPRPLAPRGLERVVPDRAGLNRATGRLVLLDVTRGRNMAGVRPGEVKKLLVLETLPKPINYTGGMDPLTWGGSFSLERVVGTVPVEADGSAHFELPALRSFFFVALDEHDMSVKRMQSFVTVQPGETTTCVGCHERRSEGVPGAAVALAARRPASQIEPLTGVPDVMDFPRDVQPILDRRCLPCHDAARHEGGVVLTGHRGPLYSVSYANLTVRREFVDGRDRPVSNLPPRAIGSSASPLLRRLTPAHHGVEATEDEVRTVRLWIDSGAPYPGTYGALGAGGIGAYAANNQLEHDFDWPESRAAAEVVDRRCAGCHAGERILPRTLSDEAGVSFWLPDWSDPRLRRSRHLVFDLTEPTESRVLLAPLAREAGGYGACGPGLFASADDPDYRTLLAMLERGKRRLEELGRFDTPGYRPPMPYLREMARYGVIPAIPGAEETVDCYALDRRYWESLWWRPR